MSRCKRESRVTYEKRRRRAKFLAPGWDGSKANPYHYEANCEMVRSDAMYLMAAYHSRDARNRKRWIFYFINTSDDLLESVFFEQVGYEWAEWENAEEPGIDLGSLGPGTFCEIWKDIDDAAELRMWFYLRVTRGQETKRLLFEFPKLYQIRKFEPIPHVGKQGVLSAAQTVK